MITLVLLLVALSAYGVHLARFVARDGLGSRPGPRSHREELGGAADQELHR